MEQIDIVGQLLTVSPALGVLAWVVWYFQKRLKEKDEEVRTLYNEAKEDNKRFIEVMTEVKNSLERINEKL